MVYCTPKTQSCKEKKQSTPPLIQLSHGNTGISHILFRISQVTDFTEQQKMPQFLKTLKQI